MTRRFYSFARPHRHCTFVDALAVGITVGVAAIAVLAIAMMLLPRSAHARDSGQWKGADSAIAGWYRSLMQPDHPHTSCCGEADAYWADHVEIVGSQIYAVITDDRPDEWNLDDGTIARRHHVPVGTRVAVPSYKIKWDRGNPTSHTVIFLSQSNDVYCYVQNGGV